MLLIYKNILHYKKLRFKDNILELKISFINSLIPEIEIEFFAEFCEFLIKEYNVIPTTKIRLIIEIFPFELIYIASRRKRDNIFSWQLH